MKRFLFLFPGLLSLLFFEGCTKGPWAELGLCEYCKAEGCRLACGVCAGKGQVFDREERVTCHWCKGFGNRWERVPVPRTQKQPDGTEKTVTEWETRRVDCRPCNGRGRWTERYFKRCSPCKGAGNGEYPYFCGHCQGTGDTSEKKRRSRRTWVEAP